jgi:protein involved in polysaccharide export with SLBB domain
MKKFRQSALWLLIAILGLSSVAYAQTNQALPSSNQPTNVRMAATGSGASPSDNPPVASDRPELQHRNPRYKVTRDDVLTINFPLVPEMNQRVTIQPDGYITLQTVGGVYIQDMTVPEVIEAVKKAYAGVLHDPIIDVDLADFQRPYFMVHGQVGKPGQYDLRHDTTVSEAIAIAGGFLPTAKTQVFVYHRINSGWMEVKKLKLKDLLNGKNPNEDIAMQPGDVVFVPEKFIANFKKYVPYTAGAYTNPAAF